MKNIHKIYLYYKDISVYMIFCPLIFMYVFLCMCMHMNMTEGGAWQTYLLFKLYIFVCMTPYFNVFHVCCIPYSSV